MAVLAVTFGYLLSLKDTIRVCMSYIHDRLDQQALVLGGSMKDKRNAFLAATPPQQHREQRA